MKKILLLSTLILGSFYANAQLTCATATNIPSTGTYKVIAITGANVTSCFDDAVDANGNPMKGYWFKYTSEVATKVVISSDLDTNVSPKSENTLLEIFTGDCTALECYDAAGATSSTNGLTTYELFAEPGVTYYIMWSSYFSNKGFDFEVTVNTCVEPTVVKLNSNVTTTSATIDWEPAMGNPGGYEVAYIDLATGTQLIAPTDTDMINLTGLVTYGNYYFYIRSVCGLESKSEWAGPYLLSLLKEVPYASNFDTSSEIAPWTHEGDYNTYFWLEDTQPDAANTKDNFYVFFNKAEVTSNNWLFSPGISMTKDQVINTSFYLGTNSTTNRSLKLTIGLMPTSAEQKTTMYSNTTIVDGKNGYVKYITPNYTVPADGVYYIGINDFSAPAAVAGEETFMLFDTFAVNNVNMSVNDFISNQFSVFPNPTNDLIALTNSANINVNSISITDLNGRIVKKGDYTNVSNIKINLSDLASGVYMMSIVSDKGTATKKVIKN